MYTFGEEETLHAFPYLLRWRLKLNSFKVPGAIFGGRWWCFFMPRADTELVTVVGKPLQLPKIERPSREQVKKFHDQYIAALVDLFERHKRTYAKDPTATLQLF